MKRLLALFGIVLFSAAFSGCATTGGSGYSYGPAQSTPAVSRTAATKDDRGDGADITNDSSYTLDVITIYASDNGWWRNQNTDRVMAGEKKFVVIPAPMYYNYGTCGTASVTIRAIVNGKIYSSVEHMSVCNTQPTMPSYLITDDSVKRRIEGQGDLWDKVGW